MLAAKKTTVCRDGRGLSWLRQAACSLAASAFARDVVLCDISLPDMDGYDVARILREEPALADVWLVALTGYAQPEDLDLGKVAGFNRHLAKPPTMDAVEQVLNEMGVRGQDRANTA